MLTIADGLCGEYGWTLGYVMGWNGDGINLAEACMLLAAISLKYGRKLAGPSYAEQEILAELEK